MKHISDEQLLHDISDAVSKITPEKADELWNQPVNHADGSEWYLDTTNELTKKKNKKLYLISAVAACCLLCLISTFMFQVMPSASVYLDVNPSILLKVNNRDHVTDAVAKNEDAELILQDLDLRGTDLNVALYAILGSMVHNGYLSKTKDTVLVSVHSADTNREDELKSIVSTMIENDLDRLIQTSDVLTHSIDTNEIKSSENNTNDTPGKDAFIQDLLKQYPQLSSYPLQDMTMDEIVSLLKDKQIDYSHYKNTDDHHNDDSDDDVDDDVNDDDSDDDSDDDDHDDNDDDNHDDNDDD